jgi:DNA repair exonuclease SbcCD ATPase subunit
MSDQENPMRNDNTWKGEEIHSTGKPYHEGALGQLQRDLWELRKDYSTDTLAYEQDMINANRRIEALMSAKMETRALFMGQDGELNRLKGCLEDACKRIEVLEKSIAALEKPRDRSDTEYFDAVWSRSINARIDALEKRYPPLTTIEARIKEIEKRMEDVHTRITGCYDDLNGKIADAEKRIAALETYRMDSNAVEARQDDDINRLKGRVGDAHERIKALEDRLQTVWIAPINELKERCFALETASEAFEQHVTDHHCPGCGDESVCAPAPTVREQIEALDKRITNCCNALDGKCAGLEDRTDGLQMDKADKAAIEKYSGRLIEERVRSLENANENNSRFALDIRIQLSQLQSAVASLKLLIPPPQPPCPPETKKEITLERIHADQMEIYDLLRGMIYDLRNVVCDIPKKVRDDFKNYTCFKTEAQK